MPTQSTRARIIEMAEQAFGRDEADSWLQTPWRMFGNRTPLDLASSEGDAGQVEDFIANLLGADQMMLRAGVRQVAI